MEQADGILALVRDLMFSSKIAAEARAQQIPLKIIRDAAKLPDEAGQRLIVDLNQEGAIEAAAAWKQSTGGRVIGFVSHVDADAVAAARQAGIDQVMARSQFVAQLPNLLRSE